MNEGKHDNTSESRLAVVGEQRSSQHEVTNVTVIDSVQACLILNKPKHNRFKSINTLLKVMLERNSSFYCGGLLKEVLLAMWYV